MSQLAQQSPTPIAGSPIEGHDHASSTGKQCNCQDSCDTRGTAQAKDPSCSNAIFQAAPGNSSGWAAVEKSVRDFDEQQAQDCKEDIDTLLVFAGLFSAVLTAFVVESYQLLQEDTGSQALRILSQIASQTASYTFQGGMLNTTAIIHIPPAFRPGPHAIRINVLWFASLLFSLSTASFGILVKQWLRAYLALTTSSPQGRLRIRHFRHSGLVDWKVYEIAAILPMLLQVALGLFFVGLCYFTADVYATVGFTTLPLVAGWAFFIFTATVWPAFSARCPYKTTARETMAAAVRTRIDMLLCSISVIDRIREWTRKHTSPRNDTRKPYNEAQAVSYEGMDLEILEAADALQSNDELLDTTMMDALKQSQPQWEDVIKFLLEVLRHRTHWDGTFGDEPTPLDCLALTRRARTAIVDILVDFSGDHLCDAFEYIRDTEVNRAARWAVCILFSPSQYPLPDRARHLLQQTLLSSTVARTTLADSVTRLAIRTEGRARQQLGELLNLLCHACQYANADLETALRCIQDVVQPTPIHKDLLVNLSTERWKYAQPWSIGVNLRSLENATLFLVQLLQEDLSRSTHTSEWTTSHDQSLMLIMQLMATVVIKWGSTPVSMSKIALLIREVIAVRSLKPTRTLLLSTINLPAALCSDVQLSGVFSELIPLGGEVDGLLCLQEVVKDVVADSSLNLDITHAIKLSYTAARIARANRSKSKTLPFVSIWRRIFTLLAELVDKTHEANFQPSFDDKNLIDVCLYSVDQMDIGRYILGIINREDEDDYDAWRTTFKEEESPFVSDFVSAIMKIYTGHYGYRRGRYLSDMRALTGLE